MRQFYKIKFQKRGMSHAHILFRTDCNINPEFVDSVVSTEILKFNEDAMLFYLVTKQKR